MRGDCRGHWEAHFVWQSDIVVACHFSKEKLPVYGMPCTASTAQRALLWQACQPLSAQGDD
jgi:hypothetical protein